MRSFTCLFSLWFLREQAKSSASLRNMASYLDAGEPSFDISVCIVSTLYKQKKEKSLFNLQH